MKTNKMKNNITIIDVTKYRPADMVKVCGKVYGADDNECYYVYDDNKDVILETNEELDVYKYYRVREKPYYNHMYAEREDVYLGTYKSIYGIFDDPSISKEVELNSEE
jgi:hypothetical protein